MASLYPLSYHSLPPLHSIEVRSIVWGGQVTQQSSNGKEVEVLAP